MLAGRGEELLAALQNHGNPAVCKTCRVPAETIEPCTIFQKICRQNDPRFGVRFWTPKRGPSRPDKQIKLRLNEWTPFWGPKTRFVGKIVVLERKKAQVSIVSSCTRQKFPIPLGFQGFAAPRVLVLHTPRTFMSTHVLELGRALRGDTVLLVFLDPKMKATHSPENAI